VLTDEWPRISAISRGAGRRLPGERAAGLNPLPSFFWLLLLLAASPWRAEGQAAEPQTIRNVSVPGTTRDQEALLSRPMATSGWLMLDHGGTSAGAVDLFNVEAERRPRWLLPTAGAAAGGAFFTYLTYRACQEDECIFPVGPPLIGIALGALLGWGADAITRSKP
jgi:hypothetical protein